MQLNRLFAEAQKHHQKGQLAQAKKRYEQVLTHKADHGLARLFLALVLQQAGQIRDAVAEARRAMADMPGPDVGTLVNYGVIMKNAGQLEEAEQAYRQALQQAPGNRTAKANLATLQLMTGKWPEAEQTFLELTETLEEPAPWLNLARIAIKREDVDRAAECLQQAEDIHPKHPDIPFLRAQVSHQEHDDAQTFAHLAKALQRQPSHGEAWQLLQRLDPGVLTLPVIAKLAQGLADTGVQQATLLATAVDICRKNLVWPPLTALEALLTQALDKPLTQNPSVSTCFTLLGADVPQRGHLKAAAATWHQITRQATPFAPRALPTLEDGRKLRVGFVSSDLRSHAVGFLVVGLMEHLPKDKTEWFVYNNSFSDDSETRTRIRQGVDRFVNIAPLTTAEAAERIRDDEIDVLVDLNGMTRDTRAEVLALRPAPIQLTWLGMPGTLGAPEVDYILGDPWVTYAGNAEGFAEQVIQLPRSYQPNDYQPPVLELAGRRSDHALPEDAAVFCCFNQHYKISPDTFALWCRILKQVEGSVLWLLDTKSDAQRERLYQQLDKAGIARERLVLAGHKPQAEHIARISLADLVLDTWPYNAHTTCSDALRSGVPVVTLPGETFAARVAASILHYGDLAEWIVETPDAYVEKAVAFAQQSREVIEAQKHQVRETYWQSAMVDNTAFGQQLEALCHQLHAHHAQGHSARPWRLEPDLTLVPLDPATAPVPAAPAPKKPTVSPASSATPSRAGTASSVNQRLDNLTRLQKEVIGLDQAPLLVDVGAAAFDWDKQLFDPLVEAGLMRTLGFEPDPKSFAKLQQQSAAHRQYVDQAVGNGSPGQFHLCNGPHMNSLLPPNTPVVEGILGYQTAKVVETLSVETVALNDVQEADGVAMIKLDTQGTELDILQHAERHFKSVVVLQFEASMLPMYENQPSLFTLGAWLEEQGFIMHSLAKQQPGRYVSGKKGLEVNTQSQLLEVDPVFIPSPLRWHDLAASELLNLAFLMHALYRAHDVSLRALVTLDQRDNGQRAEAYAAYLKEAGYHA
ncbi:FkbM family methyltransferase [Vreelandella jeotgali]|uniref:FkbM family methyltransferase n=1 Tax=Vreelandella jeotgali TaxID=553386 RepID=UPI000348E422|nr:FkbM family methyltransferase [Halomonas jeotgali]